MNRWKQPVLQTLAGVIIRNGKMGVDLDDTCWVVNESFIEWHNRVYLTDWTRENILKGKQFSDPSLALEHKQLMMERHIEFHEQDDPELLENAEPVLRLMAQHCILEAISYRCPDELTDITQGHIMKKLDGVFNEVLLCGHREKGMVAATKKHVVLKEKNIMIMFEDDLTTAEEIIANTTRERHCVILLDVHREVDNEAVDERIQVLNSWEEIQLFFEEACRLAA